MDRGNVIVNASGAVFRKLDEAILQVLGPLTGGRRCTGDWIFWTHYLMRMGRSVSFDAEALSCFRCHEQRTRSLVSRSREKLRFAEYSFAIASVLRITRPWPLWRWHAVATSGGRNWILYEYLWRYRPSWSEKLWIQIIHGPLRLGIYTRRLQSKVLRGRYWHCPPAEPIMLESGLGPIPRVSLGFGSFAHSLRVAFAHYSQEDDISAVTTWVLGLARRLSADGVSVAIHCVI